MKPCFLVFVFVCLSGCASLGIHVVNDSLTAAQHNDLGWTYEQQNKLALAEKEYTRARKKDRDWHLPSYNLANIYYKMGKPKKAAKYYRRALKSAPNDADSMNNLAFVLLEQGNAPEARKWIEKAIAIEAKPAYLDTREKIRRQYHPASPTAMD